MNNIKTSPIFAPFCSPPFLSAYRLFLNVQNIVYFSLKENIQYFIHLVNHFFNILKVL